MNQCPKCGSTSYTFADHAVCHLYSGEFGKGRKSEECVHVAHRRGEPVFCKCDGCGKKFRLTIARDPSVLLTREGDAHAHE